MVMGNAPGVVEVTSAQVMTHSSWPLHADVGVSVVTEMLDGDAVVGSAAEHHLGGHDLGYDQLLLW